MGDTIELGGQLAKITKIGLRSTMVRTGDQADVIVPNTELITNRVTNWTLTNRQAPSVIPVGVAYGSDIALVMQTLKECALAHPGRCTVPSRGCGSAVSGTALSILSCAPGSRTSTPGRKLPATCIRTLIAGFARRALRFHSPARPACAQCGADEHHGGNRESAAGLSGCYTMKVRRSMIVNQPDTSHSQASCSWYSWPAAHGCARSRPGNAWRGRSERCRGQARSHGAADPGARFPPITELDARKATRRRASR